MTQQLTAQEKLTDFRSETLNDRHERQHTLLLATGVLSSQPHKVLDLGCGSGVTAVWAARKGWSVTAVDIVPSHVSILNDHIRKNEPQLDIKTVITDACSCEKVPDNYYDIVYLKDLLEHVEDYRACLATAFRKLTDDGLIYIATTNVICPLQLEYHGVGPYSWYPRWLKDRIRIYAMKHKPAIVCYTSHPALHWFSRRTLGEALTDTGFKKVWDIYDLIKKPQDLTRRTRIVYPFVKYAKSIPFGREFTDLIIPCLTMVAQK